MQRNSPAVSHHTVQDWKDAAQQHMLMLCATEACGHVSVASELHHKPVRVVRGNDGTGA